MAENSEKKRVLIVEDQKPMSHALQIKLTSSGFDVTIANDGEEALKILETEKFDIILLDLIMPRMDGFVALQEMKKRNVKAPVIVASNLGQEDDIKKAKDLGASDYFIKSNVSIADIIEKIKNVLKM